MRLRYVSSSAEVGEWKLIMPIFIVTMSERSLSWIGAPPENLMRILLESILSAELTLAREAMFVLRAWSSISLRNSMSTTFPLSF